MEWLRTTWLLVLGIGLGLLYRYLGHVTVKWEEEEIGLFHRYDSNTRQYRPRFRGAICLVGAVWPIYLIVVLGATFLMVLTSYIRAVGRHVVTDIKEFRRRLR